MKDHRNELLNQAEHILKNRDRFTTHEMISAKNLLRMADQGAGPADVWDVAAAMCAERGQLAGALAKAIESTERMLLQEKIADFAGESHYRRALQEKLLELVDVALKDDEGER